MLHTISWTIFLLSCACVAVAYYLFIGLVYYSKELKALASGNLTLNKSGTAVARSLFTGLGHRNEPFNPQANAKPKSPLAVVGPETPGESLTLVCYRCEEEIKQAIRSASAKRSSKEELLYAMHLILAKDAYSSLIDTIYKSPINNFIQTECAAAGGSPFSATELDNLWKK